MLIILLFALISQLPDSRLLPFVQAEPDPNYAAISPARYWGPFFGTKGDIQVDINRTGIAVRVEIPREFLSGVVSGENDTHFIESNIRNDYYYYSVIDESKHWSYGWKGNVSDAPCFKPNFSIYDPNAPWCVEIWNYLNGTFKSFTLPKFVRFRGLNAPLIAGVYNFTLFVADHPNSLGFPDFVNAWNETLLVPVSMGDNPASIGGIVCDADDPLNFQIPRICPPILAKGVVYARNVDTGQEGRAYVNQTTGAFNLTGLAPGTYEVQGSAGVFHGVAYSLSRTDCLPPGGDGCSALVQNLNRGDVRAGLTLRLKRAPQVCGEIEYWTPLGLGLLSHSLTDHPYLTKIGMNVLNITVEATDSQGHVFRYQNVSTDQASDSFRMVTGAGVKYVGLDPYGTEFAGLPSVQAPHINMSINVWITGYLQTFPEFVTISATPGQTFLCNSVSQSPIIMETGAVITGTIRLLSMPPADGLHPQTPHQGEVELALSPTDKLFGGNILIQANDHTGMLRATTILNGTLPDGTVCYASYALSSTCRIKLASSKPIGSSIQFYIIGFSEYYNRTWQGVWSRRDYGLPEDTEGYTLTVSIRGYEQSSTPLLPVRRGENVSVTVLMVRGGVIDVGVTSYHNRFGTRSLQAVVPFRFLNLSIPARARVYFYDSVGRPTGYAERLMVQGVPNGVDTSSSFTVLFAGQNWSIRQLLFFGLAPTHVTTDTYTIKAFTLGYVQLGPVTTPAELAGLSLSLVALLMANEIGLTVPIFAQTYLFYRIPENDFVVGQAYNSTTGDLTGAVIGNFTAGIPSLDLTLFGFGGMFLDKLFAGQGHFFYVAPDGTHYYDYGFDVGNYTVQVPEFGFNRHFMQKSPVPPICFKDLFLGRDVFVPVISMARVIHGIPSTDLVSGWADDLRAVPLSWVQVQASSDSSIDRFVPTLDGRYGGAGALNLPQGTYNITFSVAFYEPQTESNFHAQWNGSYALLPPDGPLCPIGGLPGTCDPPLPSPPQSSAAGLTLQEKANDAAPIVNLRQSYDAFCPSRDLDAPAENVDL
jgi:hypothetical protein